MADLFRSAGVPLWLSLPARWGPDTPLIVTVHGISRNAEEHVAWLGAAAAERAAVAAALFDAGSFPHYQRLGLDMSERRADLCLDAALDALERETGLPTWRFHLFGFSGGAQFAHRYALLNPRRVRSLHLAAAGYYTWLDESIRWPRGLGRVSLGPQMAHNRNYFLRLPIDVYVGCNDTARDASLRQGRAIDRQQGSNRRARAAAWCAHLRGLQGRFGLRPAGLTILPGTDHDFVQACIRGELDKRLLGAIDATSRPGRVDEWQNQVERDFVRGTAARTGATVREPASSPVPGLAALCSGRH